MSVSYRWTRFVYPQEREFQSQMRLGAAGGKQPGPDGVPDGRWQLHELRDVPVLAVLGERGIGKTSILEAELAALEEQQAKVKLVTVTDHYSVDDLVAALTSLVEWAHGAAAEEQTPNTIHVLIDGLDDATLARDAVARAVTTHAMLPLYLLRDGDVAVRIVLACRTPVWSLFDARFGAEGINIHAVTVAALGLEDIAAAAEAHELDGAEFVDSLARRGLLPLAELPATLIALLKAETAPAQAPTTLIGAYEAALRTLCKPERQALDRSAEPLEAVVDAASLIGAYTRLSGHWAISLDQSGAEERMFGVLPVGELVARTFKDAGHGKIAWSTVVKVAESGIYRGQGANIYRASHASYTDFLTARFLNRLSNLPAPRMLELLLGPRIEGRRRVWLELAEVAGLLASYHPAVYAGLLQEDPWALLRSDLHSAPEHERRKLVDALLSSASVLDDLSRDTALLNRVDHSSLAAQLAPAIKEASAPARIEAAFEIATACRPPGLTDTLADVALDAAVERRLRVKAIMALPRPVAPAATGRLLAFARTARQIPADQELAYWIVDALWPESTTAEELTPLLPETSRSAAARRVLQHTLPIATPNEALPGLLEWVFDAMASGRFELRQCAVRLLARAAAQDEFDPRLPGYLADVIIRGRLVFPEEWQIIGDAVRTATLLLRETVNVLGGRVQNGERVTPTSTGLLAWLLTEAKKADASVRGVYATAIMAVADLSEPRTLQAVRSATAQVPELIALLPDELPEPVTQPGAADTEDLASRARLLREVLATSVAAEAWPHLLSALLGQSPAGPVSSGWRAHAVLLETTNDRELIDQVQRSALAFTTAASPEDLIVTTSTRAGAVTPNWKLTQDARLGLRAFELLAAGEEPRTLLDELEERHWRNWTGPLLYLAPRDAAQHTAYGNVLAYAYEADRDRFPDLVIEHVAIQYDVTTDPEALEVIDSCWDKGPLERDLSLRAAASEDAGVSETVLRKLMRLNPGHDAYRAALDALEQMDTDGTPKPAALGAALALLAVPSQQESLHSPVWSTLAARPKLLGQVLAAAPGPRQGWASALNLAPPELLPQLYTTAREQYPPEQDSVDVAGPRSKRANAEEARDTILREIASSGEPGSLEFLQQASSQESRPEVFDRLLKIAYTAAISQWVPTTVEHLAALVADPSRRLVNDSAGLLETILAALDEFEDDLQGGAALAHLLWNETDDWCRPKPEVSLSDLTAWFLDLKLAGHKVVINREVQVRRVKAAGMPDSVDIKAQLPQPEGIDNTAPLVVIEVKGAWNRKLMDDIETQLHARYLKQPGSLGLYLVGYYSCPAWEVSEPGDSRRAEHGGIEQLRQQLTNRAGELTPPPRTAVIDVRLHTPTRR